MAVSLATANPLLPGDQPPVSVSIAGPSETRVDALAIALSQRLAQLSQLQNVSNGAPVGLPQIGFTVNRAQAAASSVTTEAIDQTLPAVWPGRWFPSTDLSAPPNRCRWWWR